MLSMKHSIITLWGWWRGSRCQMSKEFLVLFEQHEDDRGHLSRQPPNHLLSANQPPGSLIDMTFARHQTIIDLFPVRVPLNRSPDDQIHALSHGADGRAGVRRLQSSVDPD